MTNIRENINAYLRTADESKRRVWRKWSEDTTEGAELGLTVPPPPNPPAGGGNPPTP